jgi:hypothetical protein
MTDIWRSFVAQRIAWENDWSILFESSTVWQDRNDHDLMRDFSDEVPGYLHNRKICDALQGVRLKSGTAAIGENLRICYEALVAGSFVKPEELDLVDAWLHDLAALKQSDSPRDTNVAWPSIGSQVAAAR